MRGVLIIPREYCGTLGNRRTAAHANHARRFAVREHLLHYGLKARRSKRAARDTLVLAIVALDDSNAARQYTGFMIKSFRCKDTQAMFSGTRVARFANVQSIAMRKLAMLNQAARLDDLRVSPGNRLEALKANRAGQHSIRVNDQFRVCFRWTATGPEDVEIVDYH